MDIIAHRGASAHAPENTLAAFRLAWEQGADGIEMDVHLSLDGRVMVHHDEDTSRSAGVSLRIADTDSTALRDLDVGRWKGEGSVGESMPFLEDVLAAAPAGSRVLVEIKCGPEILPALETALGRSAAGLRLALISFDIVVLAACRAELPELPCYLVWDGRPTGARGKYPRRAQELIEIAQAHDFAGLDAEHRRISAAFAAAVRGTGLKLMAWTVNNGREARRLRDLGLEAVTSDRPAELRQALER